MILLDTNVVSEPLKPAPNVVVTSWLDRQPAEPLFLSATSKAELLVGVARLPAGKRKRGLDDALSELLAGQTDRVRRCDHRRGCVSERLQRRDPRCRGIQIGRR